MARSRSGDAVAVDDPLVEISTDKVDAELPSPVAGTVAEILVEPDATVAVGHRAVPDRGRRGARRGGGPVAPDAPSPPAPAPPAGNGAANATPVAARDRRAPTASTSTPSRAAARAGG